MEFGASGKKKINWVDKRYMKHYTASRRFLMITAAAISILLFRHDDVFFSVGAPIFFTIVVYLLSFPTSFLSMKMINWGDKRKKTWQKVLLYVGVLLAAAAISVIMIYVMFTLFTLMEEPLHLGDDLSSLVTHMLLIAIAWVVIVIALFLPWLQSMLVLILRKWFIRVKSY